MPESSAAKLVAMDAIAKSMTNHKPSEETQRHIEAMRADYRATAKVVITFCEPSRERSLALTKLEESLMWAVKGLILQEQGK